MLRGEGSYNNSCVNGKTRPFDTPFFFEGMKVQVCLKLLYKFSLYKYTCYSSDSSYSCFIVISFIPLYSFDISHVYHITQENCYCSLVSLSFIITSKLTVNLSLAVILLMKWCGTTSYKYDLLRNNTFFFNYALLNQGK